MLIPPTPPLSRALMSSGVNKKTRSESQVSVAFASCHTAPSAESSLMSVYSQDHVDLQSRFFLAIVLV